MGFDFLPFWPSLAGLSESHNRRPPNRCSLSERSIDGASSSWRFRILIFSHAFDGPDLASLNVFHGTTDLHVWLLGGAIRRLT
jgi:hypothetical protein